MSELLGSFEQAVLLAIVRLAGDAYGRTIMHDVSTALGREVAAGAIYATLDRLEGKGLVSSGTGPGTAERGGRVRRFYSLTGHGAAALNQTRETLERVWAAAAWPVGGGA